MMANPKLVRDRVEEGSLNPLEGMMSTLGAHGGGTTPASTPTAAAAAAAQGLSPFHNAAAVNADATNGTNGGGGGGGEGVMDDDAWTSVFGPRSPLLVPPSAPLAPPPRNHPYVMPQRRLEWRKGPVPNYFE
jgi:hypothetical protein